MDDVIDDLIRSAMSCERAAKHFETDEIEDIRKRVVEATSSVDQAWSGSFIGYQANVYTVGLRPRRPGEHFDSEWGSMGSAFVCQTTGEWAEYTFEQIHDHIMQRAGNPKIEQLDAVATRTDEVFERAKVDILSSLDVLLADGKDGVLREKRDEVRSLESHHSAADLLSVRLPQQIMTRDTIAAQGGRQAPPHMHVEAQVASALSYGSQVKTLGQIARHTAAVLQKRHKMKGRTVAKTDGKIFIGHGQSFIWTELKNFLVERLELEHEEFNRESVAGLSNKERLLAMLDSRCFAFLVLTAEDEHTDDTQHARENVIHEAGLFQGRYGFERAIILLEDGCSEFSNIHGISQIRFPQGDVMAKSEEIRRVLEREDII